MNNCKYFRIIMFLFLFCSPLIICWLIPSLSVIIIPSFSRDTCSIYPTLSSCSIQLSSQLRPNEGGRRHQAVCGADSPESGGEGSQAYL